MLFVCYHLANSLVLWLFRCLMFIHICLVHSSCLPYLWFLGNKVCSFRRLCYLCLLVLIVLLSLLVFPFSVVLDVLSISRIYNYPSNSRISSCTGVFCSCLLVLYRFFIIFRKAGQSFCYIVFIRYLSKDVGFPVKNLDLCHIKNWLV